MLIYPHTGTKATPITAQAHPGHAFWECAQESGAVGLIISQDWADLEPAHRAFDWSFLDEQLALAAEHGLTLGLRIFVGGTAAPEWATKGCPIATVNGVGYVVPWAQGSAFYRRAVLEMWETVARYYDGRLALLQLSLIGTRQAELVLDDDGSATTLPTWCRPQDWEPAGLASDAYSPDVHVLWAMEMIAASLKCWRKTPLFLALNRMGFNATHRNIWQDLGNPPAVPNPSEEVAARVLDWLAYLPSEDRERVLPAWTGVSGNVTVEQRRLLDQIAYGGRSWLGGTCFDLEPTEILNDGDVQRAVALMRGYDARVVRLTTGVNKTAERHTLFAGLE